jgi:hypothetical protein
MRALPQPADFSIRPSIRVLGAVLLLSLAYVFVDSAIPLFEAGHLDAEACTRRRGRWICELTRILWSFVPSSIHGEVEGTSGVLAAAFLVFAAWLLIKPLLQRPRNRRIDGSLSEE